MLWKRLLSAVVGIPVIIAAAWLGGIYFFLLTVILFFLGLTEIMNLLQKMGLPPKHIPAFIGGGILLLAVYFYGNSSAGVFLPAIMFLFLFNLLFTRERKGALAGIAATFFATLYVGLLSYLYLLRGLDEGIVWLVILLACTWANDTAAYFGGKKFGKTPLAVQISPGKTREGAICGIAGCLLIAYLLSLFYVAYPASYLLVLGFIIAVAGQVGDLVESAFKREAGIKDTGHLIPGHVGVLDRFDSLMFTAPLVYHYVRTFIIS